MDLYDQLVEHFRRDNWDVRLLPHYHAVEVEVRGENGDYRVVVVADEERSVARYLVFLASKVPESRRREVMEFLTRANYGLLLGNFEMDLNDGEVRVRCSLNTEGTELGYEQHRNMLYVSIGLMDRYLPGLKRVIQGTADPLAAIVEIESS